MFVLRRIAEAIETFEPKDSTGVCRQCGAYFSYDLQHFAGSGPREPRHCLTCLLIRRVEREHTGGPTHLAISREGE